MVESNGYGSDEDWGDQDAWDEAMEDYGAEVEVPELKRMASHKASASVTAFGGGAGMFYKFICSDQI